MRPGRAATLLLLIAAQMTCGAPATRRPDPIVCDHSACPPAYACRWLREDAGVVGRCHLTAGRCNSDLDCAPATQRCQRFGVDPGVCVGLGL